MPHFDSKDEYHIGSQNVSHCQQQPYSGLRSPGRSYSINYYYYIITIVITFTAM